MEIHFFYRQFWAFPLLQISFYKCEYRYTFLLLPMCNHTIALKILLNTCFASIIFWGSGGGEYCCMVFQLYLFLYLLLWYVVYRFFLFCQVWVIIDFIIFFLILCLLHWYVVYRLFVSSPNSVGQWVATQWGTTTDHQGHDQRRGAENATRLWTRWRETGESSPGSQDSGEESGGCVCRRSLQEGQVVPAGFLPEIS